MHKPEGPGKRLQPNQHFPRSERLFRRLPPGVVYQGLIALDAVELPDISCNREMYSAPEDVIRGFPDWGIAALRVGDIPREQFNEGTLCKFRP